MSAITNDSHMAPLDGTNYFSLPSSFLFRSVSILINIKIRRRNEAEDETSMNQIPEKEKAFNTLYKTQ